MYERDFNSDDVRDVIDFMVVTDRKHLYPEEQPKWRRDHRTRYTSSRSIPRRKRVAVSFIATLSCAGSFDAQVGALCDSIQLAGDFRPT